MGNSSARRSPCFYGRIPEALWDHLGVFNHRDHSSIAPAHRFRVTIISHPLDTFLRDSAPQLQLPFHQFYQAGSSSSGRESGWGEWGGAGDRSDH